MIYFDNAATTCVTDEVMQVFLRYAVNEYANISSKHIFASDTEKRVKSAIKSIGKRLGVDSNHLLFTSGATESNNMAIFSMFEQFPNGHFITSEIEHPSVLEVFKFFQRQGFKVDFLKVNQEGLVDVDELLKLVNEDTKFISIMYVNNEIGSVQPISEISKALKNNGYSGYFHSDVTQALGKYDCNIVKLGVDVISASAHKLHAPKGVGLLAYHESFPMRWLLIGGAQQRGMRSGTVNTAGITSFAKAIDSAYQNAEKYGDVIRDFRKKIYDYSLQNRDICKLIGGGGKQFSPYINSLAFKNIKSEVILHSLEQRGIMVASSSACSSKNSGLSHVLTALHDEEVLNGAIRISFSHLNTHEEVDEFLYVLNEVIADISKYFK